MLTTRLPKLYHSKNIFKQWYHRHQSPPSQTLQDAEQHRGFLNLKFVLEGSEEEKE